MPVLILDQVEQMRGELRTYGTGLKGRIRLLSNTAGLAAFLPNQLGRFLVAYGTGLKGRIRFLSNTGLAAFLPH